MYQLIREGKQKELTKTSIIEVHNKSFVKNVETQAQP
jgi:hypothetical protein